MMQYQYLVSGAISIFLSLYILAQHKKSLALNSLMIYGIVVSLWEITSFMSKMAPDAILASQFYRISLLSSHLCYPLYFWSVLNISKRRNLRNFGVVFSLFFIQIIMMMTTDYFSNYEFYLSNFGWFYRVVNYNSSLIVVGTIILIYYVLTLFSLLNLIRRTAYPLLKKKYSALFFSFIIFRE